VLTVGFHIWLFTVTFMGRKGRFRMIKDWRGKLSTAGLELREIMVAGPSRDEGEAC
jgi:hypothetical protein